VNAAEVPDELLTRLRQIDTPSVCNAIEVAQGQRGFDAFTRGTPLASDPAAGAVVGFAVTAIIAAREPPDEAVEVIRARRLAYFRAMASAPKPSIAVVQDLDYPACIGAWWGEVHTAVHKGLGMSGALTDGAMRDLGDLAEGFPVIAGSLSPSHGFVHVRDVGVPVSVYGLSVNPGDLVHADRHGAVIVPPDVWPRLPQAIERMFDAERIILEPARQPGFDIDALEAAWHRFEVART